VLEFKDSAKIPKSFSFFYTSFSKSTISYEINLHISVGDLISCMFGWYVIALTCYYEVVVQFSLAFFLINWVIPDKLHPFWNEENIFFFVYLLHIFSRSLMKLMVFLLWSILFRG
jgi:hypothetical protein